MQQIEGGITTHLQVFEHFHRVIVPGFPYNLYYRIVGDKAVVVGVIDARFDPNRIQEMLMKRI